MEPAVLQHFGRFLWVLVIAHHDVGTLDEDFAVRRNLNADTIGQFSNAPNAQHVVTVGGVHTDHRGSLCQAVAFQHSDSRSVEEPRQAWLQGRRTARHGFDAAQPQGFFHLAKDQFPGKVQFHVVQSAFVWIPLERDTHRPIEDGGFHPSSGSAFRHDAVVEFFQEARHRREHDGLGVVEVFLDGFQAVAKVDLGAHVHVQIVEHPLENVTHGQETQDAVIHVGIHCRHPWLSNQHVARHIVVGQHDALGKSSRARRVDDGRQLGGIDGVAPCVQLRLLRVRTCLGHLRPVPCAFHLLKGEDFFQVGTLVFDRHDFGMQFCIADKAILGATVGENVLVILFRHGGVDGHIDATCLHDAVVHDVPLATVVVADQGHFFFGLHAHGNQPPRDGVHLLHKLCGGEGDTVPVVGHGHHHVLWLVGQLITWKIEQASRLIHGVERCRNR